MTYQRLADDLVAQALGWRPAPDRYIKPGRSWITRSRFKPLDNVDDALRLLDALTADYSLIATPGGAFTVKVCASGRVGEATGEPKARSICLALGRALGIEVEV